MAGRHTISDFPIIPFLKIVLLSAFGSKLLYDLFSTIKILLNWIQQYSIAIVWSQGWWRFGRSRGVKVASHSHVTLRWWVKILPLEQITQPLQLANQSKLKSRFYSEWNTPRWSQRGKSTNSWGGVFKIPSGDGDDPWWASWGGGLEWEEQELRWSFHLDILIFFQHYRHNYPISILCNKCIYFLLNDYPLKRWTMC